MMGNSRAIKTNSVEKKLRSDRGASITFALLLFLVCAALSAAVLVAGTVAAGRMSGIAESDQKYYSVTSAAELIEDMMDGKVISYVDSTHVFDVAMNRIDDDLYSNPGVSDASKLSSDVSSVLANLIQAKETNSSYDPVDVNYDLAVSGVNRLSVDIVAKISVTSDGDGKAEFVISDKSSKPYKLKLTFSADVRKANPAVTRDEDTSDIESTDVSSGQEIKWKLESIVSAYDADSNWR